MIYIITKYSFVATWDAAVEYHPGDIIPMGAHEGWKIVCPVPYDSLREEIERAVNDELFRFQCNMGIGDMPDTLQDEVSDDIMDFCEGLIQKMAQWFKQRRYK